MSNFVLSLIGLLVIGNLLISCWVYADAKTKGLKPWLRIFLTILALLNTSGLIIYAILRNSFEQKTNKVICPQCHGFISNEVKFCPNCGVAHDPVESNIPVKSHKYFLISGLSIIIIGLGIIIGLIIADRI
jgi:glucose uptake protein GlcU